MRFAILGWSCDICEEEESPSATTWREVSRLALAEGWTVVKGADDEDIHYCPKCSKENG